MYVTVVGLSYRLVICLLIPSFATTRILRKTPDWRQILQIILTTLTELLWW